MDVNRCSSKDFKGPTTNIYLVTLDRRFKNVDKWGVGGGGAAPAAESVVRANAMTCKLGSGEGADVQIGG